MKRFVLQSAGGTRVEVYARSLRAAVEHAAAQYPDSAEWRPIRID